MSRINTLKEGAGVLFFAVVFYVYFSANPKNPSTELTQFTFLLQIDLITQLCIQWFHISLNPHINVILTVQI